MTDTYKKAHWNYSMLEFRKANRRRDGSDWSERDEMMLKRYKKLVDTNNHNLSASAWKFWNSIKKGAGIERRERALLEAQTQMAESFP